MDYSKKTKAELIAELKKLQRKLNRFSDLPVKQKKSSLADKRWDSFFKNSANIVIIVDKKGAIIDINRTVSGLKKQDVIGASAYNFVEKESVGIMKKAIATAFKTTKPQHYKISGYGANKKIAYYSSKLIPIVENKKTVAVIIDTIDITNETTIQLQLKQNEEKFRMLAENAMDVIYRYSIVPQPHYEYISPSILKMSGYTANDFYKDPFVAFKIVHPDDLHLLGDSEESLKKDKKISGIKDPKVILRWIKKDGTIIWTETKTHNIYDAKGNKIAIEGISRDITAQKQSIENYKSLVDYSPDGVMIHIDGKIIFANPSALKIIGAKTFSEIENQSAFNFIHPDYHQQTLERIKAIKKGETPDFNEIKIKTFEGKIKTIETRPIAIKFNNKDAIQVVFHDVTAEKQLLKEQIRAQIAEETNQKLQIEIAERLKTEKELQETQNYTRLLIDSSLDMICASDKKGYITEFNKAAQKIFGYTTSEIIGKHVSILYSNPSDRIKITDDELYKKGTFSGEVVNIRKNGDLFTAFLSASVLKNENGEIIGAMGVSRDITELKRAEEELRKNENMLQQQAAKLHAIIESSSHVIWTINKKHELTSFNKNFITHMVKRYGITPHIGLSMIEGEMISSNEYNKFWIDKYTSAFKGKSEYFETKLIDKFGNLVWREIYLNPIFNEKGQVIEISGIGHDITEKKLVEEKIKQSLQEKEVLLKEVHHRVKNNLQVISSILNLQSSYVKDAGTLNILKESQNRIKSMAFIHESLYQTKDFSSINFSEYVVNLSNNLIHSYSNFEYEIKLNLDIQNVFLNLDLAIPCGLIINEIISNALKYAFVEKQNDGEISIEMKTEDENLILKLSDNGAGLPKNIDFRNTESLGLQLVVTLTEQLNGTIELDTTNGTAYTIIFNQTQAKNRI